MAEKHLSVIQNESPAAALIPSRNEWTLMREMAASLIPTGFLPNTIRTPEQAVAIMLKGRELRVPPMYALSNIVVVQGKPSCSAELMLALVQRDFGAQAMRVKSSTNEACTVEYRVPGWDDVKEYTFTIEDARKANLMKNQVWNAYPAAMLRARCISAVCRMAFPSAIGGMYAPGELGDAVSVTPDGEVLSASVDTETGEIVEMSRHNAPEKPQDAPGREIGPNPTPDTSSWQQASTALHAEAGKHGITHEQIKAWLLMASRRAGNPAVSTKDIKPQTLTFVRTQKVAKDPEKFKADADAALNDPDIHALVYPEKAGPVADVFPPKVEVIEAEPVDDTEEPF